VYHFCLQTKKACGGRCFDYLSGAVELVSSDRWRVVFVVVVIVKLCLGGGGCRGSDDSLLYLLLVSDGKSLFYLSEVNQV